MPKLLINTSELCAPKLIINMSELPRSQHIDDDSTPKLVIDMRDLPAPPKREPLHPVLAEVPQLVINLSDMPKPTKPAYELNDGCPGLVTDPEMVG